MARKGTPMPMKLPSGQVVWIRVEDEDDEPDPPAVPPPWSQPAPYGDAPSPYAPAYGPPPTYVSVPLPPPGSTYGYDSPYPGGPQGAAPPGGDPSDSEPSAPRQWTPPLAPGAPPPPYPAYPAYPPPGSAPDYGVPPPPGAPQQPQAGWLDRRRARKAVQQHVAEDARQLHGFTEAVSGIAESVRDGLRRAQPDTVEIEFGLDIDVSAGAAVSLIADARAKAAVRITLGWDNRENRESPARVIEGSSVEGPAEESDPRDATG